MPIVVLRYFNVIGPRCRSYTCLDIFGRRIAKGLPPIVHGSRISRDFTHVADTVEATIKASKLDGETFNICAGKEVKLFELAWMVIEEFGADLEPIVDPSRLKPHEAIRHYSQNKKAMKMLDWQPKFSAKDAVRGYVKWFKSKSF